MLMYDAPADHASTCNDRKKRSACSSRLLIWLRSASSASWPEIHSTNASNAVETSYRVFSFAAFNGGNLLFCGTASPGAAPAAACDCFPLSASLIDSVGGGLVRNYRQSLHGDF